MDYTTSLSLPQLTLQLQPAELFTTMQNLLRTHLTIITSVTVLVNRAQLNHVDDTKTHKGSEITVPDTHDYEKVIISGCTLVIKTSSLHLKGLNLFTRCLSTTWISQYIQIISDFQAVVPMELWGNGQVAMLIEILRAHFSDQVHDHYKSGLSASLNVC